MINNIKSLIVKIVVIIIILMIIFNPNKARFNSWFMEDARWHYTDKNMIQKVEEGISSEVYNKNPVIERKYFAIFSLYIVPSDDSKNYVFIGLLNNFKQIK